MRFPRGCDLKFSYRRGVAMSGVSRCTTVVGVGLSLVLLCASGTRSATAQGVSLGFKGGLNSSTLSSKEEPELVKTRTGFNVGGVLSIQSSGPFALRLGAAYTKKGADLETGVPDVTGGIELTYVEVPVLATIIFPTGPASKVAPLIFAGPVIGIETGCKVKAEGLGVSASVDGDAGGTEDIPTKSVDVGVMFGGGLQFDTGPASIVLEVAYTLGLVNIDDTPMTTDEIKNRNLSFSVGLMFPLGVGRTPGL